MPTKAARRTLSGASDCRALATRPTIQADPTTPVMAPTMNQIVLLNMRRRVASCRPPVTADHGPHRWSANWRLATGNRCGSAPPRLAQLLIDDLQPFGKLSLPALAAGMEENGLGDTVGEVLLAHDVAGVIVGIPISFSVA